MSGEALALPPSRFIVSMPLGFLMRIKCVQGEAA